MAKKLENQIKDALSEHGRLNTAEVADNTEGHEFEKVNEKLSDMVAAGALSVEYPPGTVYPWYELKSA